MAHTAAARRLKQRGVVLANRGIGRDKSAITAAHLAKKGIVDLSGFETSSARCLMRDNLRTR
jgi:hypothetical protein